MSDTIRRDPAARKAAGLARRQRRHITTEDMALASYADTMRRVYHLRGAQDR